MTASDRTGPVSGPGRGNGRAAEGDAERAARRADDRRVDRAPDMGARHVRIEIAYHQRLGGTADEIDYDAKILAISAAAEMAGMHPQTLRQYDRLGLVEPARTPGGGRRYSVRDVTRLREIQRLSQDEGVNLAGIKRIMDLEREVQAVRAEASAAVEELARELQRARAQLADLQAMAGPFGRSTDIVLWRGEQR
nr:helix-turn-helix transcriptional regulator [Glycomyces sp. NEAU-S30]